MALGPWVYLRVKYNYTSTIFVLIKFQFSLYCVQSYQANMTSNAIHRDSKKHFVSEFLTTKPNHQKKKESQTSRLLRLGEGNAGIIFHFSFHEIRYLLKGFG